MLANLQLKKHDAVYNQAILHLPTHRSNIQGTFRTAVLAWVSLASFAHYL